MRGGRPICKSTYIYKWGMSSPHPPLRGTLSRDAGEGWGEGRILERRSCRELHDALPRGRRRRAERRQRREHLRRRVVRVERAVEAVHVLRIRQVERLGDELQPRAAVDADVARDPRIERELIRQGPRGGGGAGRGGG